MSQLFSPIKIKDLVLKNRIVVSPMCQYSSIDGFANDWHFVHLGSRAVGGAALVITEAAAISPEGRISPDDLGLWKDEHIEGLQKITNFIKANGAEAGIQLAHAGRKASVSSQWKGGKLVSEADGGWQVVAPSEIPFNDTYALPKALSHSEIKTIINDFKLAAERSLEAGFSVVEIHAAHGYLVHQFLSPLSNQRTDEYGGSFENRIRFLLEIIEEVKTVWPEALPLFVRISATEWAEGGWNEADSIKLAHILKSIGVDLIDSSTGGNIHTAKIPIAPSYQVSFAQNIKKETGILTGAVGLLTSSAQIESILVTGQADLIFLARELLRDPYFPLRAAAELGQKDVQWPVQYERGKFR
ncbi:NADPH dehydrogenase NamA [Arcicella lustrica]|uniref:NADPH dehydrogenase NamA n=1 Tax=Arcicella lustrica TaxID=2984196 RepID=A0ABU5SJ67_9BACT|nr:NADPH dehydrogenase NamA [Arcicella sp. DC25W]MEA5427342.1 NADPH dehydrogenase NamA [Arcicella sp. DC25W]